MKIERIEALPLSAKMKPLRIATTTFTECRALIVCITTDDGLTGIGESLVRSAPRATKYHIHVPSWCRGGSRTPPTNAGPKGPLPVQGRGKSLGI